MRKFTLVAKVIFICFIGLSVRAEPQPDPTDPYGEIPPSPTPTPPPSESPPAPTAPATPKKDVMFAAGFGYRSTQWKHFEDPSNTNTTYNIETANNTIIEGDIAVPKVALKLGFNVLPQSSGMNNAQQFAGYLGIKGFSLVSELGKFSGHARYSGTITAEQKADVDFNQEYRYTELDYTFAKPNQPPWTIGLRYTQWKLPTEIALLSVNQSSGPTVFDPDFQASFYSLLFGFDLFKNDWMGREEPPTGWGTMFKFLVGMGAGSSQIGDVAVRAAKSIHGKTVTETKPAVMTVHTNGQIGPKYAFDIRGFKGAIGFGYDWNILMLINMSQKASTTSEAQPVAYPNFIYHGWLARLFASF